MADARIIETERLILRPHRLEDFGAMCSMWGDADVVRYISGKPSTPEECWTRLMRYAGHWLFKGYGYWAVTEKGGGAFVGELGFMNFMRALEPSFGDTPEMGWALASSAHGKGYGTEACSAALNWARDHFGGGRVVCLISPENAPSLRLADKLGFSEFGRAPYRDTPSIQFERALA